MKAEVTTTQRTSEPAAGLPPFLEKRASCAGGPRLLPAQPALERYGSDVPQPEEVVTCLRGDCGELGSRACSCWEPGGPTCAAQDKTCYLEKRKGQPWTPVPPGLWAALGLEGLWQPHFSWHKPGSRDSLSSARPEINTAASSPLHPQATRPCCGSFEQVSTCPSVPVHQACPERLLSPRPGAWCPGPRKLKLMG